MSEQNTSTPQIQGKRQLIQDFEVISLLGEGAFGKVYLAKKSKDASEKLYAIKQVKMETLNREKKNHQIYMEKLQIYFDFPGIPKMYTCFKNNSSFYFVMDYASGGPFEKYLRFNRPQNIYMNFNTIFLKNNLGGHLQEDTIKFYAAEMVLTLEYLHTQGLAHRDFKPENMVLTKDKHLQLIDFGTLHDYCSNFIPEIFKKDIQEKNLTKDKQLLNNSNAQESDSSKEHLELSLPQSTTSTRERLATFCGTNDYLSPEMLLNQRCDSNGDLWALGCIIYQMYAQKTPFHSKVLSYQMLKSKITKCDYLMPNNIPEKPRDLIEKLLVLNPSERLGGVKVSESLSKEDVLRSYEKLKAHPFFEGVNWVTLFEQNPTTRNSDVFVRKNQQKKMTAPPTQNHNMYEANQNNEQIEVKKKKQSEDLNTLPPPKNVEPHMVVSVQKQVEEKRESLKRTSDICPDFIEEESRAKLLFEGNLFEKKYLVLRTDVIVQVWEESDQLILRVLENNATKKLRFKINLDPSTQIRLKQDRVIILTQQSKKKTFIDNKLTKASVLYNILLVNLIRNSKKQQPTDAKR